MQERVMQAMNKYEGTAEYPEQKHDTKVYNADDETSSDKESTQELKKAKISHSGKDQIMLK